MAFVFVFLCCCFFLSQRRWFLLSVSFHVLSSEVQPRDKQLNIHNKLLHSLRLLSNTYSWVSQTQIPSAIKVIPLILLSKRSIREEKQNRRERLTLCCKKETQHQLFDNTQGLAMQNLQGQKPQIWYHLIITESLHIVKNIEHIHSHNVWKESCWI